MNDFDLSRDQVRELDRRAVEEYDLPSIVLMENAGRGCADLLMRLNAERLPTVILCGPGNNGGDGFVIARHLDNARWPVFVWVASSLDRIVGDAHVNYRITERCRTALIQVGPAGQDGGNFAQTFSKVWGSATKCWVVDALFGTGLSRSLQDGYAALVRGVNECDHPVLAIDVPTGMDCDTGEPLGPTVRAAHTATFVAPKLGFRNPAAKQYTGEVHVIDIGVPRKLVDEYRRRTTSSS